MSSCESLETGHALALVSISSLEHDFQAVSLSFQVVRILREKKTPESEGVLQTGRHGAAKPEVKK